MRDAAGHRRERHLQDDADAEQGGHATHKVLRYRFHDAGGKRDPTDTARRSGHEVRTCRYSDPRGKRHRVKARRQDEHRYRNDCPPAEPADRARSMKCANECADAPAGI